MSIYKKLSLISLCLWLEVELCLGFISNCFSIVSLQGVAVSLSRLFVLKATWLNKTEIIFALLDSGKSATKESAGSWLSVFY